MAPPRSTAREPSTHGRALPFLARAGAGSAPRRAPTFGAEKPPAATAPTAGVSTVTGRCGSGAFWAVMDVPRGGEVRSGGTVSGSSPGAGAWDGAAALAAPPGRLATWDGSSERDPPGAMVIDVRLAASCPAWLRLPAYRASSWRMAYADSKRWSGSGDRAVRVTATSPGGSPGTRS